MDAGVLQTVPSPCLGTQLLSWCVLPKIQTRVTAVSLAVGHEEALGLLLLQALPKAPCSDWGPWRTKENIYLCFMINKRGVARL